MCTSITVAQSGYHFRDRHHSDAEGIEMNEG